MAGWIVAFTVTIAIVMVLQVRSARADLTAAQSEVSTIQDAIVDGDSTGAQKSLAIIQDRARGARATMHQPQWAIAARLPFVGDDIGAVRTVTAAIGDIGDDVLPTLVDLAGQVNTGAFAPKDGVFDFAALRSTASDLSTAQSAFVRAAGPVATIDPDDLVGALRDPVVEAQDKLADASATLSRVASVADILPDMADGDHDYLVVFQNNAELRAQGGLPGAWAQLKIRGGKVSVGQQGAGNKTLSEEPVEQVSAADIQAFTGDFARDFRRTAFTPDTPTASRLQSKLVEKVFGVRTDGVISLDPVTLSYLLKAVGPIKITQKVTLTSDNAVDLLLSRIYALQPDTEKQDAFFALVTREIFGRIADGKFDTAELARGLVRGGEEGRVRVWAKDEAIEAKLAKTGVGGAIPFKKADPAIGLYLNDLTGAKMNYYLRFSSKIKAVSCTEDGVQTYELRMIVGSAAPPPESLPSYVIGDGKPPGSMTISLEALGPAGGAQPAFSTDGKAAPSEAYEVEGRPGSKVSVTLVRGSVAGITVTMTSPPGHFGPTKFAQTPTIRSGVIPATIPSACS